MTYLAANLRSPHREEAQQWGWRAEAARLGERTDEVPADVMSAAADLGAHQVTFGRDALPSGVADIGCGLGLAVIPGGIGVLLASTGAPTGWVAMCFLIAVAIPVVFAFGVRSTRAELPERAWVFERGFVWGDRQRELTVLPWSRIRVLRTITRYYQSGTDDRTEYAYTVVRDDGTKLPMTHGDLPQGHLFVLGETIEREIVAIRVPRALTAIAEGRQLAFGGLAVDATGISAGSDTLPWHEVEAIDVAAYQKVDYGVVDQLRIKRSGAWLTWANTRVADIPDVAVLLAVAETLRGTARDAGSRRP
jgi:hypothetical protein